METEAKLHDCFDARVQGVKAHLLQEMSNSVVHPLSDSPRNLPAKAEPCLKDS